MTLPRSRFLRYFFYTWFFRMTPGARFLLMSIFFSGMVGSLSLTIPVYHLFLPLGFVYVFSFLCCFALKPRLRISGELPRKVTAGETLHGELVVQNASSRPAYSVGLAFPGLPESLEQLNWGDTVSAIPPGESVRMAMRIRARRRGLYALPKLQSFASFPFHLFRREGSFREGGSLMVLPRFHPLTHFRVPDGLRYQPGGISLTSNIGESPEYIGNREYRPGDLVRRIDHRSWARLATPVVREFQEEYYCRLALVLDTFIPKGRKPMPEGYPELEAGISLSASIADALARGDYIIDLLAAGPQLYVFRGGRSIGHFDNILEILACLEKCQTNPFETIAPALADELSNITAVIFVLLDWDEGREKFVRLAVESGATARVFIVRDQHTSRPFAAAEDWAGPIVQLPLESVLGGGMESP